jgi:hypothetical protein
MYDFDELTALAEAIETVVEFMERLGDDITVNDEVILLLLKKHRTEIWQALAEAAE